MKKASSAATFQESRPTCFAEYIGQEPVLRVLEKAVHAAKARKEMLRHILAFGPPGLGKTALAHALAGEMEVSLTTLNAGTLDNGGELLFSTLQHKPAETILFLDEIHRLRPSIQDVLCTILEEFRFTQRIAFSLVRTTQLTPFTLFGATVKAGLLLPPLRNRFTFQFCLDFYTDEELVVILANEANRLNFQITQDALYEIARCSRETPRVAKQLLYWVRDYSQYNNCQAADLSLAHLALADFGIDSLGLSHQERSYLNILLKQFNGGPVGLASLASALFDDPSSIEDTVEPFLLRRNLIARTPRGRVITDQGASAIQNLDN